MRWFSDQSPLSANFLGRIYVEIIQTAVATHDQCVATHAEHPWPSTALMSRPDTHSITVQCGICQCVGTAQYKQVLYFNRSACVPHGFFCTIRSFCWYQACWAYELYSSFQYLPQICAPSELSCSLSYDRWGRISHRWKYPAQISFLAFRAALEIGLRQQHRRNHHSCQEMWMFGYSSVFWIHWANLRKTWALCSIVTSTLLF